MRIPRLFVDQPLASGQIVDLDPAASRYLGSVLRMETGRPLIVFNGQGGEYLATIHAASKKQVSIGVGKFNPENRESPLHIALGIGLSKGDRFDLVVQKATELGVNHITPLLTSRAEVKLNKERAEKKLAHWRQIAISASEQCQRNIPPTIATPQKLQEWLDNRTEDLRLVLHHRSDRLLAQHLKPSSVALVIGPEGGLDDDEIQLALKGDFQQLTLGPRVFRTETAPMVALSLVQYQWGDF